MHVVDELVAEFDQPFESLLSLGFDTIKNLIEDLFHLLLGFPRSSFSLGLIGVGSLGTDFGFGSGLQLGLDSACGLDLGERSWGSGGLVVTNVEGIRGVSSEESSEDKLRFVCLHDLSLLGVQV